MSPCSRASRSVSTSRGCRIRFSRRRAGFCSCWETGLAGREVAEEICRIAAERFAGVGCAILTLDAASSALTLLAAAALPAEFAATLSGLTAAAAQAVFRPLDTGAPDFCEAMSEEPAFVPLHAAARAAGLESCWSAAIRAVEGDESAAFSGVVCLFHSGEEAPRTAGRQGARAPGLARRPRGRARGAERAMPHAFRRQRQRARALDRSAHPAPRTAALRTHAPRPDRRLRSRQHALRAVADRHRPLPRHQRALRLAPRRHPARELRAPHAEGVAPRRSRGAARRATASPSSCAWATTPTRRRGSLGGFARRAGAASTSTVRRSLLTVSVGVGVFPWDGSQGAMLLANAEVALRAARAAGGDGFRIYSASLRGDALSGGGGAGRRGRLRAAARWRAPRLDELELLWEPYFEVSVAALGRAHGAPRLEATGRRRAPAPPTSGGRRRAPAWLPGSCAGRCATPSAISCAPLATCRLPVRLSIPSRAPALAIEGFVGTVVELLAGAAPGARSESALEIPVQVLERDAGTLAARLGALAARTAFASSSPASAREACRSRRSPRSPGAPGSSTRYLVQPGALRPAVGALAAGLLAMARQMKIVSIAEQVDDALDLTWLGLHRCDLAQGAALRRPVPADQLARDCRGAAQERSSSLRRLWSLRCLLGVLTGPYPMGAR